MPHSGWEWRLYGLFWVRSVSASKCRCLDPVKAGCAFAGSSIVDNARISEKKVEIQSASSNCALYRTIPPALDVFHCSRGLLHSDTCKNSKYHKGIFADYHARKGAFCYAKIRGDKPRCRSPPFKHSCSTVLRNQQQKGSHYEC